MDLVKKKCVPCEGGEPKLNDDRIKELLGELRGWQEKDEKLCKSFRLKDFVSAIAFVNRVADLAEKEGHHPDFCVHLSRVDFSIFTHAVAGLSENDFILAAKIDTLA
jgi:4a-hydroxytetrahydrobiopterin dehydratase